MRREGAFALLKSTGKRRADVIASASKTKAPRLVVSINASRVMHMAS